MTLQKGKFIKFSSGLAVLLASAGLALASPDLSERRAGPPVETAKTAPAQPEAAWPPAVTSEPQIDRYRQASLDPSPEVESKTKAEPEPPAVKVERKTTSSRQAKRSHEDELVEYFSRRGRIGRTPQLNLRSLGLRRRWF